MSDNVVTEDQCLICRLWKPQDRPSRRVQHFARRKDEVILIPVFAICEACSQAHWQALLATKH